jgi:hypothetical protein
MWRHDIFKDFTIEKLSSIKILAVLLINRSFSFVLFLRETFHILFLKLKKNNLE